MSGSGNKATEITAMQAAESLMARFQQLQPMPHEAEEALKGICRVREIEKNKSLQLIGDTCRTLYFVHKGLARIHYYHHDKDVTEYFAFPNDTILRAESLFTGKPSPKGIQALKDSQFLALPAEAFFALFTPHPVLEILYRKIIETAYVETLQRLEAIQFQTAEDRYKELLRKSPHIIREVPLRHVSSYLGITQVSLSRIRARLR